VNRAGEDRVGLYRYCGEEGLPILMSLPEDRQIAGVISRGDLVGSVFPEYGRMFSELGERLRFEVSRKVAHNE